MSTITTSALGATNIVSVKPAANADGSLRKIAESRAGYVDIASSDVDGDSLNIHAADAAILEKYGIVTPYMPITPATLTDGTHAVAYGPVALAATGGVGPYTYEVADGSTLPAGMTLSSGGSLGGTPTTADDYEFDVLVTDSLSRTYTQTFAITIA